MSKQINSRLFTDISADAADLVTYKLEKAFRQLGFKRCIVPKKPNILRACEDPNNMMTFQYGDLDFPLTQTQQMYLEEVHLKDPIKNQKIFTWTTSYRYEPKPILGRHKHIFEMFEFEQSGDIQRLIETECAVLANLGFRTPEGDTKYPVVEYEDICQAYGVDFIEHEQEQKLEEDYGSVVVLKDFPIRTSPFWNMKLYPMDDKKKNYAKKVDVIVGGMETFGSAERSCNVPEMRKMFHTVSNGEYAKALFTRLKNGKERTLAELEEYFKLDFKKRNGAGMGLDRLVWAMQKYKLL